MVVEGWWVQETKGGELAYQANSPVAKGSMACLRVDKIQDSTVCCLQKIHFSYKYTDIFIIKEWNNILC